MKACSKNDVLIKKKCIEETKKNVNLIDPFLTHRPLNLKLESPNLQARFRTINRTLRKSKKRSRLYPKVYQLNIFPDEFTTDAAIEVDEPLERDPEKRELRTQVEDLKKSLAIAEQELNKKEDENSALNGENKDLINRNIFLGSHVNALEQEVVEARQVNGSLKEEVEKLNQAAKEKEKERNKVYGRKEFSECSKDTVDKTRAAYRHKVVDSINHYGANRGLTVKKLVLEDKSGRELEVNARKPHTYEELNQEEKKCVETASLWKDTNRIADRVYSSLANVGTFPAAAHVKQHEQEVNKLVGVVLPVNCTLVIKMMKAA